MVFNINNFFDDRNRKSKIADFQDLDHLDGVSVSTTSANLYNSKRDDLVLFYFRAGANYASVYTQSKIISENLKLFPICSKSEVHNLFYLLPYPCGTCRSIPRIAKSIGGNTAESECLFTFF